MTEKTEPSIISEVIQSKIGKYSIFAKRYQVDGVAKITPAIRIDRDETTITLVKLLSNGKIVLVDKWNPSIEAWHKCLPSIEDVIKKDDYLGSDVVSKILEETESRDTKNIEKRIISTRLDGKFYTTVNDLLIVSGPLEFNEENYDGLYLGDFLYGCFEGEITDPSSVIAGLKLLSLFMNLPKEKLNRMNGPYAEGFISPSFENPYPKSQAQKNNDWNKGKDFALKIQSARAEFLELVAGA